MRRWMWSGKILNTKRAQCVVLVGGKLGTAWWMHRPQQYDRYTFPYNLNLAVLPQNSWTGLGWHAQFCTEDTFWHADVFGIDAERKQIGICTKEVLSRASARLEADLQSRNFYPRARGLESRNLIELDPSWRQVTGQLFWMRINIGHRGDGVRIAIVA